MNFRPTNEIEEPRIDIAPLIDIVFQLLIFFLLTSTFALHPVFNVTLPTSSQKARQKPQKDEVAVNVTRTGQVLIDGKAIDDAALASTFRAAAKAHPDTVVLLQADTNATHGRVVHVMDLARTAGLKHLAIVTKALPGGSLP